MEGAQLGLEAVVSAIFDGPVDYGKADQATQIQIHSLFGGFKQSN
jgi:exportin-5